MTFEALADLTQTPKDGYYELLLTHSALIISEVGKTSKAKTAQRLNIQPSSFSGIYGCIVAYNNLKRA